MKKVILNSIPQAYILPFYIVIFTLYSIVTTYVQGRDYCTFVRTGTTHIYYI